MYNCYCASLYDCILCVVTVYLSMIVYSVLIERCIYYSNRKAKNEKHPGTSSRDTDDTDVVDGYEEHHR